MNSNLICFTNGVLDLQEKELRQGRYEDYISISIKLNFTNPKTINEQKDMSNLLEEFQQFRDKITNKRQNKLVYVV
jgi:phage/plasmid-associated DNA primase